MILSRKSAKPLEIAGQQITCPNEKKCSDGIRVKEMLARTCLIYAYLQRLSRLILTHIADQSTRSLSSSGILLSFTLHVERRTRWTVASDKTQRVFRIGIDRLASIDYSVSMSAVNMTGSEQRRTIVCMGCGDGRGLSDLETERIDVKSSNSRKCVHSDVAYRAPLLVANDLCRHALPRDEEVVPLIHMYIVSDETG
jgi:hypothetical protein